MLTGIGALSKKKCVQWGMFIRKGKLNQNFMVLSKFLLKSKREVLE